MRVALAILAVLAVQPARARGLELVLAIDVSRSVINVEYDLQASGLAGAFRDADVIDAIGWVPGGVMATVTQWSGPVSQAQAVGWRHLTDRASVTGFAAEIDAMDRQFFAAYTAVGEALWHANALSATNPQDCARRVIDISGDGASNRGRAAGPIAAALAANGVTVNGLVIRGARPDPERFYRDHVVRGPGAFLETAESFQDYAVAIRAKLLRELAPSLARR